MTERPTSRSDVLAREGYHSPQKDVEVRLNANESPFPPPAEFVDALAEATRAIDWNRYPDRGAGPFRAALAERYDVGADQVFAANGSNEVIQSLFLAYGGFGGQWPSSNLPTRCTRRLLGSPVPGWSGAVGSPTFP